MVIHKFGQSTICPSVRKIISPDIGRQIFNVVVQIDFAGRFNRVSHDSFIVFRVSRIERGITSIGAYAIGVVGIFDDNSNAILASTMIIKIGNRSSFINKVSFIGFEVIGNYILLLINLEIFSSRT